MLVPCLKYFSMSQGFETQFGYVELHATCVSGACFLEFYCTAPAARAVSGTSPPTTHATIIGLDAMFCYTEPVIEGPCPTFPCLDTTLSARSRIVLREPFSQVSRYLTLRFATVFPEHFDVGLTTIAVNIAFSSMRPAAHILPPLINGI